MTHLVPHAEDGRWTPSRGSVGIIGAGLIGTSVGLVLRAQGIDVLLADADPANVDLAAARGAGRAWPLGEAVAHALLAVPPGVTAAVLADGQRRGLARTWSDTASIKGRPLEQAVALGCDLVGFCPAHPVAGRERGGPAAAQRDLFVDRAWVLCPTEHTSADALADARAVAVATGATAVVLEATRHDRVMAAVSHVPQLLSSVLASSLDGLSGADLAVAGPGLRDMTRLAASDPALWTEIVSGNRLEVLAALRGAAALVDGLVAALEAGPVEPELRRVLESGRRGRARLPEKGGRAGVAWTWVNVVIEDRPGELARLFTDVTATGVNIEEVRLVDHSADADRPAGIVALAVSGEPAAERLRARLEDTGRAVSLDD